MVFFRNLNLPSAFVLLVIALTRTVRALVGPVVILFSLHPHSSRVSGCLGLSLTKQRHSYCFQKTVHSIRADQLNSQPTIVLQPTLQLICSWRNWRLDFACAESSILNCMRFAILVVATAAAHTEQHKSATPVQTALCTFSLTAFLNSLDSTMGAPAACSHVTPLQSHRQAVFFGVKPHPHPHCCFANTRELWGGWLSFEKWQFNYPTRSLGSTELSCSETSFRSLAATGMMLSGYLPPHPAFLWANTPLR